MSQTTHEDVVAGLYAAFGRGDVPAVLSGLDQEIEWRSPENLPTWRCVPWSSGGGSFL